MNNIARNSKFNIKIDFEKSHDSYLYDKNTDKQYLDFFGMYASLPLGYNHKIFDTTQYKEEMLRLSKWKVNNCEFVSDETIEFDNVFSRYAGKGAYKHFHYSCTGALAVEAAIKACMEYKKHLEPQIISFHNSFHGINSYGGFITSRFYPATTKLDGIPEPYSTKLNMNLEEVYEELMKGRTTCIIVEPIQCSAGDLHHDRIFFVGLKELGKLFKVPIIHDEIQIGFGTTGHLWHYEHLKVEPDIVVFGKKTQLSGIMVKEEFGQIFDKQKCTKLEVTWDADVLDMVRCKYIIQAYEKYDILKNVIEQSDLLLSGLSQIRQIQNLRNCGLIIGFDMSTQTERDMLVRKLYTHGLICNRTGERSIRLRPNLNLSAPEVDMALEIFNRSV